MLKRQAPAFCRKQSYDRFSWSSLSGKGFPSSLSWVTDKQESGVFSNECHEVDPLKSFSVIVFVLVVLIQMVGVFDHSLWTPDEPREAQIIREMADSGNYLIPTLGGKPFLEKPPLYYLLGIVIYKYLGDWYQESARLASVLFGLATLAVVFFTFRRLSGKTEAGFTTLVLATMPLFFISTHKILVDVGLMFFITAAMCSFLLAYKGQFRIGYYVFWLCLALAFLVKGIKGLAIPMAGIIFFMVAQRDYALIRRCNIFQGSAIILIIMLIWAWALYIHGGYDFVYEFYVYNQIGRFIPAGTIYTGGHVRPFYFYLLDVPVQTLPWSVFLYPAYKVLDRKEVGLRFLFCWILGGLVLLSMASTKREIYFLPMFPAIAGLVGIWMSGLLERQMTSLENACMKGVLILIALAAAVFPLVYIKLGGFWLTAELLFILTAGALIFMWRNYQSAMPYIPVMVMAFTLIVWIPAMFPLIDQVKSYKPIYQEIGKRVEGKKVMGYKLNETVEALAPFYGGFHVKNIEDMASFYKAFHNRSADFIIVLPERLTWRMKNIVIPTNATLVYEGGGKKNREIELWEMNSSP